jgi:hypothetical protein
MALSIEDANTIKADDGVLITKEGRRIQIDAGAIEEWSIPTGTQGATNYFIIGFHLYTDSNSAEVCETFVEQMENATDTIPEDTFREGSTEVYVSLGRVVQSGINLDSVTSLVQTAQSFEDVKNAISQLNSDLDEIDDTLNNNNLTREINITSYTSDNMYLVPSDGYVQINASQSIGDSALVRVRSNDKTITRQLRLQATDGNTSLFVKKGMKVYVSAHNGNAAVYFYPLG